MNKQYFFYLPKKKNKKQKISTYIVQKIGEVKPEYKSNTEQGPLKGPSKSI